MYSFAQRNDIVVHDEPLYASYLSLSGYGRPYREAVLAAQSPDGNAVMESLAHASKDKHVYVKHMAKFIHGIERKWLREGVHVLLVREPVAVVSSFSEVLEATLEESCYPSLCSIASELRSAGKKVVVVLSDDLVQRPEQTLRALCSEVGLSWDPAMLRWPAGPKPYDGVWASYWYRSVHASTGWGGQQVSSPRAAAAVNEIPQERRALLNECHAMYSLLLPYALVPEAAPEQLTSSMSGQLSLGDSQEIPRPTAAPTAVKAATHSYVPDPRNADILVGMRDGVSGRFTLEWRPHAKVSVLDSGFVLGDGVWEGLRVHKGVIAFAREHLDRLYQGAKALAMDIGLTKQQLQTLIYKTLDANGMRHASGVHIRLMVTRGLKPTPYQNPNITIGSPTIVILPEWKAVADKTKQQGIALTTVHVRRGPADVQDAMWNSHSKLNCIAACIQANNVGADEGLMLDPHGFVATCNSVNFFIVVKTRRSVLVPADCNREEEWDYQVWAPTTKYQLHGITRATVLQLCRDNGISCCEKDFTLTEVYSAEEAFVTGTFAGLIPVASVDGRVIGMGARGDVCFKLQELYMLAMDSQYQLGRVHFT